MVGREARPVVHHVKPHEARLARGAQLDVPAAGSGGLDRVPDEVLEGALEQLLVGGHHERRVESDEARGDALVTALLSGEHAARERREVGRDELEPLQLDEVGEAPDHRLECRALVEDGARPGPGLRVLPALDEARVAHDRPEPVAHLVDDAGRELARADHRLLLAQALLHAPRLLLVALAQLLSPVAQPAHRLLVRREDPLRRRLDGGGARPHHEHHRQPERRERRHVPEQHRLPLAGLVLEVGRLRGEAEHVAAARDGKRHVAEGPQRLAVAGEHRDGPADLELATVGLAQLVDDGRHVRAREGDLALGPEHLHLARETAGDRELRRLVPGLAAAREHRVEAAPRRLDPPLGGFADARPQPALRADAVGDGEHVEERHDGEREHRAQAQRAAAGLSHRRAPGTRRGARRPRRPRARPAAPRKVPSGRA